MKTIAFEEMNHIQGGNSYVDGFCTGVGVVAAAAPWLNLTPWTAGGLWALGGGCTAYYIYQGLAG